MTGWVETMRGTFLARVAVVAGHELSIIGGDGFWSWRVRWGEWDLAEGAEATLADAMEMAEEAARRLVERAGEDTQR